MGPLGRTLGVCVVGQSACTSGSALIVSAWHVFPSGHATVAHRVPGGSSKCLQAAMASCKHLSTVPCPLSLQMPACQEQRCVWFAPVDYSMGSVFGKKRI